MSIYEWNGPEEPLGLAIVTAVRMTVEELGKSGSDLVAKGKFTFRDHAEGCDGESSWVATETFDEGTFCWDVQRVVLGPHHCAFTSKSGEPLFCLIEATNRAIKAFIADKLMWLAEAMRMMPGKDVQFVDEPEQYRGPKHTYAGPCVCSGLSQSTLKNPFDWRGHTNGGKYPAHCFECSCGSRWYRGNPEAELWVRVGDVEAWDIFMKFNGVVMEMIAIDPQSEVPSLVLLKSLRRRGLIPLG